MTRGSMARAAASGRRPALLLALLASLAACSRAPKPEAPGAQPGARPPRATPGPAGTVPAAPKRVDKPNVILVIGDDHGYPHYGFMGHPQIRTPHMDALVKEGTLFPYCHNSSPVCWPSLETILSGRYPKDFPRGKKNGHEGVLTIPIALAKAGYRSFGFGKFWTGYPKRGFDEYIQRSNMLAGRKTMQPLYDFIDAQKGKPFFAWYGPRLPHVPYSAPEKYRAPYEALGLDHDSVGYFANITWMDDTVGDLVRFLDARKLRDRTLLLYVADNGWFLPHAKANFSENGYRTVLWASLPGAVKGGQRLEDRLAHTIDILPTFIDYAGLPVPKDLPGRSLKPLLEGRDVPWRKYLFGQGGNGMSSFYMPPSNRYVVNGDRMKLYPDRNEMYDLAHDPNEEHNLIRDGKHAALVAELRRAADDWAKREAGPEPEVTPAGEAKIWEERMARFERAIGERLEKAPDPAARERIEGWRDRVRALAREARDCGGEGGTCPPALGLDEIPPVLHEEFGDTDLPIP